MRVERQKTKGHQYRLFEPEESLYPTSKDGDDIEVHDTEVAQALTANDQQRALTKELMERIVRRGNLNRAWKKVRRNKGSPGVDGMTLEQALPWLAENKDQIVSSLLKGEYEPQPIKGVEIPKKSGGVRLLGIPTVVDRVIQQAILQVLEPIFDKDFSKSSFGFRPNRGAHKALQRASEYVKAGREIVVDLDLEKFFDRVNHDLLMSRLARKIADKRLLRIIRRFLEAGMLKEGLRIERYRGTPQGGPLSPLLSNVMLDDLDRELERRGHCFVRYADDCNIYVRSQRAGERVLASITRFLRKTLRLEVNREKSAVDHVRNRKFLGYRLLRRGNLGISSKSLKAAKVKIKALTRRWRGASLERIVRELNQYTRGWVAYFQLAQGKSTMRQLDSWIRRRLRCIKLGQCKSPRAISRFLRKQGISARRAQQLARVGKRWWLMSKLETVNHAMSNAWFRRQGLLSLEKQLQKLKDGRKPPCT